MEKCAGCGGRVHERRSFVEEVDGKPMLFCCQGCRRLYSINHGGEPKMSGPGCH